MSYLSYVNNVFDKEPKPLTVEMLHLLLNAEQTRQQLKDYREKGMERAKSQLPAVMFNGRYVPELARDAQKGHERDDACFEPWHLCGLDIDPDEGCALTPQQQFEIICTRAKEAFKCDPKELIAMAYATPTYPGMRLVIRRTKGLTIEQEQERWNAVTPIKCDAKCKNLGRLYFLTTRDDLLYLNTDMLFSTENINPKDYPVTSEPTANGLQTDYKIRNTPLTNVTSELSEETLCDIASELEHCVGGGAARKGDRNNQVFRMAWLMRHLTGPNINLLHRVIPHYALSPAEHMQAIANALKTTPTANIPADLERAMTRVMSSKTLPLSTTPPALPAELPEVMAHLVSAVPEKTRAAAAVSSFAAWRAYLQGVNFRYIDNLTYEPCFMCICCANQTEGKTATRMPSECILEDIAKADSRFREEEERWREECSTLSNTKDKPKVPQLPIRIVEADMTNPALVKRAVNAKGYTLYTYAEELEKLNRLSGLSEIIRTAYDGGRYGQERVSASAVSQVVERLRWSFNVSTTPQTARMKFKNELVNGTLTRLSFSTIQSAQEDFGDELPIYGDFGVAYKAALAPYVKNLSEARGTISCAEALAWAERERLRQIDELRRKDQRYMVPFMKRSLQMGFWRAMMLYIMNGNVWSKEIEEFASWSIDYDLWCKLFYFGDLIEQSATATPDNSRYTRSLIGLLPQEFTHDQAREMRRDMGRSTQTRDVSNMLNQWVFRGMVRFDEGRKLYVKTGQYKQVSWK